MASPSDDDVYGGNYPKARGLAFARSSGKCQFCGLRDAEEAHHWAYYNYPSGTDIQGHDLTALCKTCHELATTMRNWMAQDGADIDFLRREIEQCKNRTEKREAISYWFYPEADDELHQDDFGDGEPMDRFYFINQQLEATAELETIGVESPTAEPPTVEPDGWSKTWIDAWGRLRRSQTEKSVVVLSFSGSFCGRLSSYAVIYLIYILGN